MGGPLVRLVRTSGVSILRQLQVEEALYRRGTENWCLINDGVAEPAVVMGISGKVAAMMDAAAVRAEAMLVVKRFTGGGTVVLDQDSIMVSLVFRGDAVPGVSAFPRPLMTWTEGLYKTLFAEQPAFEMRENDYVFGDYKFGGNAQAITRDRWVHHTSFLWDYQPARMAVLRQPERQPEYRSDRGHADFVCKLKDHMPTRQSVVEGVRTALLAAGFRIEEVPWEAAAAVGAEGTHLRTTRAVDFGDCV